MQQARNHTKVALQELRPNMLEHANGNDSIIELLPLARRRRRAIIAEQNAHLSFLI